MVVLLDPTLSLRLRGGFEIAYNRLTSNDPIVKTDNKRDGKHKPMTQGKIIEYIDQGRLICTICLEDNGNKLHLLTINNREITLQPKRALLISTQSLDVNKPREVIILSLIHI